MIWIDVSTGGVLYSYYSSGSVSGSLYNDVVLSSHTIYMNYAKMCICKVEPISNAQSEMIMISSGATTYSHDSIEIGGSNDIFIGGYMVYSSVYYITISHFDTLLNAEDYTFAFTQAGLGVNTIAQMSYLASTTAGTTDNYLGGMTSGYTCYFFFIIQLSGSTPVSDDTYFVDTINSISAALDIYVEDPSTIYFMYYEASPLLLYLGKGDFAL